MLPCFAGASERARKQAPAKLFFSLSSPRVVCASTRVVCTSTIVDTFTCVPSSSVHMWIGVETCKNDPLSQSDGSPGRGQRSEGASCQHNGLGLVVLIPLPPPASIPAFSPHVYFRGAEVEDFCGGWGGSVNALWLWRVDLGAARERGFRSAFFQADGGVDRAKRESAQRKIGKTEFKP